MRNLCSAMDVSRASFSRRACVWVMSCSMRTAIARMSMSAMGWLCFMFRSEISFFMMSTSFLMPSPRSSFSTLTPWTDCFAMMSTMDASNLLNIFCE